MTSARTPASLAFDAVLLDLDGTLMDTIPDFTVAVNAMLADLKFAAITQAEIATYIGKGSDNLIRRVLTSVQAGQAPSAELFKQAKVSYTANYHRINGDQAIIFDGVRPGLDRLQAMGMPSLPCLCLSAPVWLNTCKPSSAGTHLPSESPTPPRCCMLAIYSKAHRIGLLPWGIR